MKATEWFVECIEKAIEAVGLEDSVENIVIVSHKVKMILRESNVYFVKGHYIVDRHWMNRFLKNKQQLNIITNNTFIVGNLQGSKGTIEFDIRKYNIIRV